MMSDTKATAPAAAARLVRASRGGEKLLPEHARSHNRALVLQALYRGEGLSRADLAREVGLTRVTISDLIADLIDEGLVIELGLRADVRPGKPATLLDLNRTAFTIVALDLSKDAMFRGAVTDLDGTVLVREEIDVTGLVGEAAVRKVETLLDTLIAKAPAKVIGVGVGSPGIVDANGTVLRAPNLAWADLALQDLLAARCGLPVLVANDANAAALAERTFGAGADDMMLVRIGRGVGAGLVVGGSLVRGATSAAGEIGHVVVGTDGGHTCACGKQGCLETWLAIPNLRAQLADAPASDHESILASAGERLGIAIAPVVAALNLSEVVVSGPLDLIDGALLETAAATLRGRTLSELHGGSTLRVTALGRDIVVEGAAVMVLMGQLGIS